jgi:hypothetical protein
MKVYVYYNLHKKVFSIKSCDTKKVIAHSGSVVLSDAVFKVSKAGRERVLREKQKNVHAGVQGELVVLNNKDFTHKPSKVKEATYNPYLYESFVDKETKKPIDKASTVFLKDKRIYYWS